MGFRFRKSKKIAPGVRLNVGKKSAGISFGGKAGGFSLNSKTGVRARASLPGTGLSYSTKIGGDKQSRQKFYRSSQSSGSPAGNGSLLGKVFLGIFILALWPASLSVWFYRTPKISFNKKNRALILLVAWALILLSFVFYQVLEKNLP